MDHQIRTDRQYRVVRYHSDFGVGVIEDVLGHHLSLEQAEQLARENPPVVSDEEIEIEEESPSDYASTDPNDPRL